MDVLKRDGRSVKINLDKIHKVLVWAAKDLDVSVSQVEIDANIQFYPSITTETIHRMLVNAAANLISEESPDYQYLAARLRMFAIRKEAYGKFNPPNLKEHYEKLAELGVYTKELSEYTTEEWEELNEALNHTRDMDYAYAAINQFEGKYLVQDRVSGRIYESPQMALMLIGMCLFMKDVDRVKRIIEFYEAVSTFKISLPTPIMAGVRTPTKQFSSCVKIEVGDSLDSISASAGAVVKYVAQRAGIGINAGRIRALGSPVRGGEVFHTGCIPFYKHFESAVKSSSQGGVRGGAATLFYPLWHLEAESLLVLKNNRGVEENRVRNLDYGVQLNRLMYERLISDGNITLLSPHSVEGLYEAFFTDQKLFKELYEKAEQDNTVVKKTIKARELFSLLMQERASTGRIYIQNVDHCNTHSAFNPEAAPVRQSNLCVAPETQILTDFGYVEISSLKDEKVNVWNGEEFSEVEVRQTGVGQRLLKVTTDSGQSLECTPDHKWYVVKNYWGKPVEVRTKDLKVGDKLIKFDLPIIDGEETLKDDYVNGFYTSDGCLTRQGQRVYLYANKCSLRHLFKEDGWTVQEEYDREYTHYKNLKDKFFVPSSGFTVESRLEWLAGALDGDGCVYRNGTNQQLVLTSNNYPYLQEVQMMLQTLGVSAKIRSSLAEGLQALPKNDGTGDYKLYHCKETWRLLITSNDVYKLMEMGLTLHRLEITKRLPQRCAKHFVKVESVIDEGRVDDTFCFTEPKRHMGVFNGILTGQCLEIALPTEPLEADGNGEIALCTLGAINVGIVNQPEDIEQVSKILVRALDNLLDYQDYPFKASEKAGKGRRALGIGVINFANYLAQYGCSYTHYRAPYLTHQLFEGLQYYLLKASMELAAERGACYKYSDTSYSQGILPIDTYNKNVDEVYGLGLVYDWEWLRRMINKYGLRNSTLTAQMPSETSSQISNATNGIEPPRGLISVKTSKDGVLKQVVPDINKVEYELLWDIKDNKHYLQLAAIMQKFIDQAISVNTNYDPSRYESGRVPMTVLLQDLLTAYKLGIKTLYYHNTRDGQEDPSECISCKI